MMIDPKRVFLAVLFASGMLHVSGQGIYDTFLAQIRPFGDGSDKLVGRVAVFVPRDGDGIVGYAGSVSGLQPNLDASECNAVNGCGVHIHSGRGCSSVEVQEGHYFAPPITSDPWLEERYSSNADGVSNFTGIVNIGNGNVRRRAFVVHAEDGSRVGCGLLRRVSRRFEVLEAETTPIGGSAVHGEVAILNPGSGAVFLMGSAVGLEGDILSYLNPQAGPDCRMTNGCGTHIHSGYACTDSSTQGGHFYNTETLSADPWLTVGYLSTGKTGKAFFVHYVDQDASDVEGRVFIIHANDGSRVSCGPLLTAQRKKKRRPIRNMGGGS